MTAKSTPPAPPHVHSEKDYEQGGLFQVSACKLSAGAQRLRGSRPAAETAKLWRAPSLTASICLQRVVFPVEASLNRLLWNRSISPNSLLETSISEEVRPRDLEEEEAAQTVGPLLPPTTTSRRHTLAEVSTRFHQCNPPCKYALRTHTHTHPGCVFEHVTFSLTLAFCLSGIVVSPSDGASSDSCLKSSSSPGTSLQGVLGEISGPLASGAEGGALLSARAPLGLSSHLQPQAQGSLPAASFQEGRRASDTSLTQGAGAGKCNHVPPVFFPLKCQIRAAAWPCLTFYPASPQASKLSVSS